MTYQNSPDFIGELLNAAWLRGFIAGLTTEYEAEHDYSEWQAGQDRQEFIAQLRGQSHEMGQTSN